MPWRDVIATHYPGARSGVEITHEYAARLTDEHGSASQRTLLATSLCSDDINVASTEFARIFHGPFVLGGLGGLPFGGRTAMTAYAHHIPERGTAFIFYGPHIGISPDGELGKLRRPGQSFDTFSCGALMLALDRFQKNAEQIYVPRWSDWDFQQAQLEYALMPSRDRILSAEHPVKEITEVAYRIIHNRVHVLVDDVRQEFQCERIALLGGIIINNGPFLDDYVDVRHFEVIELDGTGERS